MATDWYAKKNEQKQKKDVFLLALPAACAVAILLVLLPIVYTARWQVRFREFLGAYSASTLSSYEADAIPGTLNGEPIVVGGDNAYKIYSSISITRMRLFAGETPAEDPAAELHFADGGVLRLWQTDAGEGSQHAHGLYISFETETGERYAFATDKLDLGKLTRYCC